MTTIIDFLLSLLDGHFLNGGAHIEGDGVV